MSARSIDLKIRINLTSISIVVLLLHALLLLVNKIPDFKFAASEDKNEVTPLNIKSIRTIGARDSKIKNSTYLSKNAAPVQKISKDVFAEEKMKAVTNIAPAPKSIKDISLKDLSVAKTPTPAQKTVKVSRPGTRPEAFPEKPKALAAISLKGNQIQDFARSSNSGAATAASANTMSGDPRAASISNSDILVNLEVPEGVNPDELNKYELMFYGFQRRTAINYVNAFYKNLDKFQRENPHLQFPMTNSKQIMTGRLTYDAKGNVTQIKMMRWSNEDKLQDFFVDVLKDMDTLHNPPQALWEKTGEFSIFFSFVVNG